MVFQGDLDDRFEPSEDARERWERDYEHWLRGGSRKLFVAADDDGSLCGFVTAERWGPPPVYRERPGIYVDELYVDPDYRRRGHGRALVDGVTKWGKDVGAREIRAAVVASNEVGSAFWDVVGGRVIVKTFTVGLDGGEHDGQASASRIGFRV